MAKAEVQKGRVTSYCKECGRKLGVGKIIVATKSKVLTQYEKCTCLKKQQIPIFFLFEDIATKECDLLNSEGTKKGQRFPSQKRLCLEIEIEIKT